MRLSLLFPAFVLISQAACSPHEPVEASSKTILPINTDSFPSGSMQELVAKAFLSVRTNNEELYKTTVFPKELCMKMLRLHIENITKEKEKQLINNQDKIYTKIVDEFIGQFRNVYNKGRGIGVDWRNTTLDSIFIDSLNNDTDNSYSGKIYFRDNSNYYIINFINLTSYNNKFYLEPMFIPYEDINTKNKIAAAPFKDEYIKGCEEKIKGDKRLMEIIQSINGTCIKCYCEGKYQAEMEYTAGFERIKNKEYDFGITIKKTGGN
jgi:hypothetical protein